MFACKLGRQLVAVALAEHFQAPLGLLQLSDRLVRAGSRGTAGGFRESPAVPSVLIDEQLPEPLRHAGGDLRIGVRKPHVERVKRLRSPRTPPRRLGLDLNCASHQPDHVLHRQPFSLGGVETVFIDKLLDERPARHLRLDCGEPLLGLERHGRCGRTRPERAGE